MPAFAHIAVATLFNSLWEAAVLALVVALALRLLPNVNATTRYAAWCIALTASLLLPLGTALPQIAVERAAQQQSAVQLPSQHVSVKHQSATVAPVQRAQAQTSTAAPAYSFRLPERLHFALPEWIALLIVGLWGAAAVLLLVRLAFNLWKLERLKSDALPLPVEYRERLERWSNADKGEREVRLCTCEGIEVPVAVGLFDSMILIPKHLLETLSQDEIDQIILHELAHLRRADDWTNGLQRVIQALFFFNPAVLYIAQQLDLEREVACDDWVVHQTREVRPYATCLTKMAEATAWPHRALAAPGVFITRRGISVRVERLLRAGRNVRTSISFGPAGAIAAALIVLFFLLQTVAPSFAFTLPAQQTSLLPVAQTKAQPKTVLVYKWEERPQKAAAAASAASPEPKSSVDIPAIDVHVPARTVRIPAVNVHVAARHLTVPPPQPLPSDFAKRMGNVAKTVNETVFGQMAQAWSGKGHFDCTACDYSNQNLAGRSFKGQRMTGADFSKSDLRNADFSYSVLTGADFSRANLSGANFSHATLTGCDLSHAQLDGVNFDNVNMTGCDVDARSLVPKQAGAVLRGCRVGCDFSYADLRGQDLRNLSLQGVDLSHSDLRGADLSGSHFQGVDLSGARLDGARLNNTDFEGCDLSKIDLHAVDFSNARITGSKMSGTDR